MKYIRGSSCKALPHLAAPGTSFNAAMDALLRSLIQRDSAHLGSYVPRRTFKERKKK